MMNSGFVVSMNDVSESTIFGHLGFGGKEKAHGEDGQNAESLSEVEMAHNVKFLR
jgi:hypothetical protein